MWRLDPDFFVPFLIFSIPIIAIVGGITAGIVRTLGQQRLIELAQRERIAAIERGVDPSRLPPLPSARVDDDLGSIYLSPFDSAKRRSQGLLISGERHIWAVGLIPGSVGIALLLSAWIVHPRAADRGNGAPPHTG